MRQPNKNNLIMFKNLSIYKAISRCQNNLFKFKSLN